MSRRPWGRAKTPRGGKRDGDRERSERRQEREAGRDREREGETDQRRVGSREAGSVPFSRSQAPIPLGSVTVALRISL